MQLSITGKNIEINDVLRQYVEKKIGRLDRYLPEILDGRVELVKESGARAAEDRQIAQVTLRTKKEILRAEEASSDIFASIDMVSEKIQRQVDRYKGKRSKRSVEPPEAISAGGELLETEESADERARVVRVKRFRLVPMDEQEAIEQMELLGHDFFVFYNANQSQVNVLYRRHNGDYGIIEPELG
jgi:putative sigma-54 modulation protein